MFWGLLEAETGVILLKIKIFYPKTGLRFALAGHISEKVFYSNSYTVKFRMSCNMIIGPPGHSYGSEVSSNETFCNKNISFCYKFLQNVSEISQIR